MYVGNKGKIVDDILRFLPARKNFIDLFCWTGIVGLSYQIKYDATIYLNDIDADQIAYIQYLYWDNQVPLIDGS